MDGPKSPLLYRGILGFFFCGAGFRSEWLICDVLDKWLDELCPRFSHRFQGSMQWMNCMPVGIWYGAKCTKNSPGGFKVFDPFPRPSVHMATSYVAMIVSSNPGELECTRPDHLKWSEKTLTEASATTMLRFRIASDGTTWGTQLVDPKELYIIYIVPK